jgi:hypothetical protein
MYVSLTWHLIMHNENYTFIFTVTTKSSHTLNIYRCHKSFNLQTIEWDVDQGQSGSILRYQHGTHVRGLRKIICNIHQTYLILLNTF